MSIRSIEVIDENTISNIEMIGQIEKVMVRGSVMSTTFHRYCQHIHHRRGRRKQLFVFFITCLVVIRFSLPLFADFPTLMEFTGDILIIIGKHERIMLYLILCLVYLMNASIRLVFIIGKSFDSTLSTKFKKP